MRVTHILGHLSQTALKWKRGLELMSRVCTRQSRMCQRTLATASKTLLWPCCHKSRVRPSQAAQQLWKMVCLALMKSAPVKQVGPVRCKHLWPESHACTTLYFPELLGQLGKLAQHAPQVVD